MYVCVLCFYPSTSSTLNLRPGYLHPSKKINIICTYRDSSSSADVFVLVNKKNKNGSSSSSSSTWEYCERFGIVEEHKQTCMYVHYVPSVTTSRKLKPDQYTTSDKRDATSSIEQNNVNFATSTLSYIPCMHVYKMKHVYTIIIIVITLRRLIGLAQSCSCSCARFFHLEDFIFFYGLVAIQTNISSYQVYILYTRM